MPEETAISKHVTVIGCGVSGLSTAINLLEAGFKVCVIAREIPPKTTSDSAGAIWYPFRCYPREKALMWGKVTLDKFYSLMEEPGTGVYPVMFTEYFPEEVPDPWWKTAVRSFRRVQPNDIPELYRDGFLFEVPFIDTSVYMPWMLGRFRELGGRLEQRELTSIGQAETDSNLIVNCSGIGARRLANDPKLYPVKGQAVKIRGKNNGGHYLDQNGALNLSYVLPRGNDIVLGGTAAEREYGMDPDKQVTEDILQRAKKLDRSLDVFDILNVVTGLRPARFEVRLETDVTDSGIPVIHNYGHGGAGFTLSWGCADDVVDRVRKSV